jgi:hypothetical protein
MSSELSHPGHVRYVRQWLTANRERIAAAVEPPSQMDMHLGGADFVEWLEKIVDAHQRCCDREYARRPPFTRYTGD